MRLISKYKLHLIGMIAGAISGWCYWHFVGCPDGHCSITSSPINSSAYGAVMGALILGMFQKNTKQPVQINKDKNSK